MRVLEKCFFPDGRDEGNNPTKTTGRASKSYWWGKGWGIQGRKLQLEHLEEDGPLNRG